MQYLQPPFHHKMISRSDELHTITFRKHDVTNCVYSYMIAVVLSAVF